ncbi:hypothetical protein DY926_12640 [Komagataeibacter melaceti]|uniref:Uncharacterized protein n=1 Tax=Komagataeibacter melaceti TaxID=2766577 RepID=A0A371YY58_9PROT|nr:hypothetical protein DY926_12640 [Komagataeibacter melaceti]
MAGQAATGSIVNAGMDPLHFILVRPERGVSPPLHTALCRKQGLAARRVDDNGGHGSRIEYGRNGY